MQLKAAYHFCMKNYFESLASLLKIEQEADREQYRLVINQANVVARRGDGFCWYPIAIKGTEIGRGDYLTIEIERTTHQDVLHQLRSGAPAALFSNLNRTADRVEGVLSWVSGNKLKLNLRIDELPEWTRNGKLGVDLLFDENSYTEMFAALTQAQQGADEKLISILCGNKLPSFSTNFFSINSKLLNEKQNEAVTKIIQAEELAIVHGPPGTGKTTTLVEALRLLAKNNEQILVTAASNAAVDLLTEKLHSAGLRVVRVGNPARISDALLKLTLDEQIEQHPQAKEIKRLRKQSTLYKDMAHKYKRNFGQAEREQRKALFDEAHKMMKEVFALENYITTDILNNAQIITATLVGANNQQIKDRKYHTLVIDEAGQALEPACWIPILKAQKVIMAGDYHQLPPTIKSAKAANDGLSNTLFSKIIQLYPESVVMLEEQYRMHQSIMQFPSVTFYDEKLKAHESVATRKLHQDDTPLIFIDTAGCGFEEIKEEQSIYNPEEAALLFKHLEQHLNSWFSDRNAATLPSIAIVAPYRKQVELLKDIFRNMTSLQPFKEIISINTIDSFQGQERDVVYISLTRSNADSTIGFLNDIRRMNVAMTRAKKKLVVIGDSATVAAFPFYASFIAWVEEVGGYHSAWE